MSQDNKISESEESGALVHNCTTCAFHDDQPVMTPDGQPVIGKTQTICRRNPPTTVAIQSATPTGIAVQLTASFPPVNEHTWCYQHIAENGAQDAT